MNQVILITGTSKGIGKNISEFFLKQGFRVAGCSRSKPTIFHQNYFHVNLDLQNEAEVSVLPRKVASHFGSLDVLINNAAIASMNHLILTPTHTLKQIFDTNFIAPFILIREAAKLMSLKKSGRIINFSTIAVPLNLAGEAAYATSKSALESLTRISAYELGPFGITVNAIGPTPIDTALIKTVDPEKIQKLIEKQAIKRKAEISDIINLIEFFINPNSSFITGQVIYLGGVS